MPAITVSIGEMVDALGRVAGSDPAGRIDWRPDPLIQKMVATWPGKFGWEKAKRLGMLPDPDMDSIIRAFIEEDLGKPA